ncbi:MAG: hypothetical protein LBQ88_17260 [Treponema sp.]|nr:hypothetical protein [Treponema sp.]
MRFNNTTINKKQHAKIQSVFRPYTLSFAISIGVLAVMVIASLVQIILTSGIRLQAGGNAKAALIAASLFILIPGGGILVLIFTIKNLFKRLNISKNLYNLLRKRTLPLLQGRPACGMSIRRETMGKETILNWKKPSS